MAFKSGKRVKLLLVIAILFLLGAGSWYVFANKKDSLQFKTTKIEKGTLTASVSASGAINPVTSVIVGSQVSGQLKEVLVDFNSEVKAGQIIARIDPEQFEYRVRQAQADLDAARANVLVQLSQVAAQRANVSRAETTLTQGQKDLQRNEELVQKNFLSPAELERTRSTTKNQQEDLKTARAQLEVANAQVKNAEAIVKQREAALAVAQADLAKTVIKSPVDGIVIKRSVDAGQTVAASFQAPELFIIAKNLRDMQVDTSVDESDISRISLNQKASFTVDSLPGRSFEGVVKQVRKAAQNNSNVVTYNVVIGFSNADQILLPGMTANVRIITEQKSNVLKVANAALRFKPPGEMITPVAASFAAEGSLTPGSSSGANPGREMRERLEKDLGLTADQKQKLDPIFNTMREKMAALREQPEESRRTLAAAARAEMRSKIEDILTPEQKLKYAALLAEQRGRSSTGFSGRGRLWILENGQPKALEVRTGVSDGSSTEVAGETIKEDMEVLSGIQTASSDSNPGGASQKRSSPPRLF